jgi:hypothetical protein
MVSKACNISKKSGDKAAAHLASSNITKKKFRDTISTLFKTE